MAVRHGVAVTDLPKQHPVRQYAAQWDHLSLLDEWEDSPVLLSNTKIVIPKGLQQHYSDLLHEETHGSLDKSLFTLHKFLFWHGMESNIKKSCDNCKICLIFQAAKSYGKPRDNKLSYHDLLPF